MLQSVLLVLHIVMAIALITFILIQQGRGATAGAAFGSGASSTVFGARGSASFLSRTTAVLAVLFFANCLLLALLSTRAAAPPSVVERLSNAPAAETAPAAPVGAPPAADTASPPADVPPVPSSPVASPPAAADMPNIPADAPQ